MAKFHNDDYLEPVMSIIATQYELFAMGKSSLERDETEAVKHGVEEGFVLYNKKHPKQPLYPRDHLYYVLNNVDKQKHLDVLKKRFPEEVLNKLLQ